MTIWMNLDEYEMRYGIVIETGKEYVLVEYKNINSGNTEYYLSPDIVGVGGNMDANIKRFHGWRGTTNNRQKIALGVRKVNAIKTFKTGNSRITLSDDLHPDWE